MVASSVSSAPRIVHDSRPDFKGEIGQTAPRIIRGMLQRTRAFPSCGALAALGRRRVADRRLRRRRRHDAAAPTTTPPPSTSGSCSIPIAPAALSADDRPPGRNRSSTDDRRTRRGRVYEQLWKHQAARGGRRFVAGVDLARRHRPKTSARWPSSGTRAISCCRRMRSTCGPSRVALRAQRRRRLRRPAIGSCVSKRGRREDHARRRRQRAAGAAVHLSLLRGTVRGGVRQLRWQRHLRGRGAREHGSERRAVSHRPAADRAGVRRSRSLAGRQRRVPADRRRCAAAHLVQRAGIRQPGEPRERAAASRLGRQHRLRLRRGGHPVERGGRRVAGRNRHLQPGRRQHGGVGDGRGRQRGDRRAFLDHPGARFRRR